MAVDEFATNSDSTPSILVLNDIDLDLEQVVSDCIPYCPCEKEFCECGSLMKVTTYAANSIYNHLGFSEGRKELIEKRMRTNTLHFWGTDHLSTKDLMNWLNDYNPINIEWIDDSSCNIVFDDENTALRVFVDKSEPFNRKIALAAARILLNQLSATNEAKDVNSLMPGNGNWFKALCVPEGAFALYLRFASKDDVKQPGAERRSNYYRLHGKPKDHAPTGSVKSALSNVSLNKSKSKAKFSKSFEEDSSSNLNPGRQLVSYSGLYDNDTEDMFGGNSKKQTLFSERNPKSKGSGSRRFNAEPVPNFGRPKKFPRKDAFLTLSDRWAGIDNKGYNFNEPRVPWNGNITKLKSGITVGGHSSGTRPDDLSEPLAAITLVPDSSGDHLREHNVFTSKKLLTSLSMVADIEDRNTPKPSLKSDKYLHIFNKRESVHSRLN